jgi:DNA-binding MarR family transcriptional regulator
MNQKTHQLLNDVNRAIIKFRGVYSAWSKKHGISYNEMLVLYTIRDNGYCTQKMIGDSYLLPKQTINNVIIGMLKTDISLTHPKKVQVVKRRISLPTRERSTQSLCLLPLTQLRKKQLLKWDTKKSDL